MAMPTRNSGNGYQSNINITPLVDVVLVLLIIFMVVSPQARRWYEVHLAKQGAAAASDTAPLPSVTLSISDADCPYGAGNGDASGECRVRVNQEQVALADLGNRVQDLYRERHGDDRVLFIAVEEQFNYEIAMRIIDQASTGVQGLKIGYALDGDPTRGEF